MHPRGPVPGTVDWGSYTSRLPGPGPEQRPGLVEAVEAVPLLLPAPGGQLLPADAPYEAERRFWEAATPAGVLGPPPSG